jgi:DNA replication protein DnaC
MIDQTKNDMNSMKWYGVLETIDQRIQQAQANGWGYSDFFSALVTDEKLYRDNRATKRRLRCAAFRINASLDHIDLTARRSLSRDLLADLRRLPFLRAAKQNILIEGPTGVGKTHLATAIGEHACREGFSTLFLAWSVLTERWLMTRADGTFLKFRDRLVKADLLILDDIGLKRLSQNAVQDLHDLLEERQAKCTVITSQLPLKNWKEIIEDELALDTIVDKLASGTMHLKIEGESYRKKRAKKEVLDNP